jgi:hypothetical protein
MPQVSLIVPTLVLKTPAYTVRNETLDGVPIFQLGLAAPLFSSGDFVVLGQARVGYGYKEGRFTISGTRGESLRDKVGLHWLPMSASLRAIYEIPGLRFVKPTLNVGAGVQWLHQAGTISSLSESYWVPLFYAAPGLTFLEGKRDDWFGGFTFTVTYQTGFATPQTVRGMSIDLGLNIFL